MGSQYIRAICLLVFFAAVSGCGCNDAPPGPIQTRKQTPSDNPSPDPIVDDTKEITKEEREIASTRIAMAIEAHGGPHVGRVRTSVQKGRGVFQGVASETELFLDAPSALRNNMRLGAGGAAAIEIIVALKGNLGFKGKNNDFSDLTPVEATDTKSDCYYHWVISLRPLTLGGFDLRPLPETKYRERPMIGVRVTRKGEMPINLWFDKETRLLSRAYMRKREAGQLTHREVYYSDFKDFEDVKLPTRIEDYRDGVKLLEWNEVSYKFLEKLDDNLFKRPS